MTTDNTQEHMHNSSEATSCAQRPAQAELDDAPDLSDTHTIVDIPGFGKVWAVKNIVIYYDTWLDWHNKHELQARLNEIRLMQHQARVNLKTSNAVAEWGDIRIAELKAQQEERR